LRSVLTIANRAFRLIIEVEEIEFVPVHKDTISMTVLPGVKATTACRLKFQTIHASAEIMRNILAIVVVATCVIMIPKEYFTIVEAD
jgi:hypothetical protein